MKEIWCYLFIVVMSVGTKNVNMDFCFKDTVNEPVLLRYLAAPSTFWLTFQRFGMPQACLRMIIKLTYESYCLFICFGLITKQAFQVFQRIILDDNLILHYKLRIYLSSSSTLAKLLPGCFSARSIFAKNSSLVIKVGSSFSFTNFLTYRVSRFISRSLSAMAPIPCQSSVFIALSCTAVILSV